MMRRYRRELSVAFVYVCLLVVLAVQAPRFYQGSQLGNILVQSFVVGPFVARFGELDFGEV